jgi:hypothetical protein
MISPGTSTVEVELSKVKLWGLLLVDQGAKEGLALAIEGRLAFHGQRMILRHTFPKLIQLSKSPTPS